MNYCRSCNQDFGSVTAFDRHRVGKHAYTFAEGLRLEPPVEDGRRCLHVTELEQAGWKKDSRGRWRQPSEGWNRESGPDTGGRDASLRVRQSR